MSPAAKPKPVVSAFGPILPTMFSLSRLPEFEPSAVKFPQSIFDLGPIFPVSSAELPVTTLNSPVMRPIVPPVLRTPYSPALEQTYRPTSIPVTPYSPPVLSGPAAVPLTPYSPPISSRRADKQAELEALERFMEESRAVHDKLYANRDLIKVQYDNRVENLPQSLTRLVDANNVAELRRTIATKHQETPKKIQQTPDRHVSGVFVSYPRRESMRHETPIAEDGSMDLISSFRPTKRPGEKMSAMEFVALRNNLLSRSEQHAVTNKHTPSGTPQRII